MKHKVYKVQPQVYKFTNYWTENKFPSHETEINICGKLEANHSPNKTSLRKLT